MPVLGGRNTTLQKKRVISLDTHNTNHTNPTGSILKLK
jgi:hypothetical protein